MSRSADQRCDGTTWNASPAWTYSTIRATFASNCSRGMFEENVGRGRAGVGSGRGTGPASRSRALRIVATAAA